MKLSIVFLISLACFGQTCSSGAASNYGGWKPAATAPHDGTVVEMMQTYGVAPWYGIFKWTKEVLAIQGSALKPFQTDSPTWVQQDNPGHYVSEDACLFWRPYKKAAGGKYVDPTGGAQNSVAYWCAAMHVQYDSKKDRCIAK